MLDKSVRIFLFVIDVVNLWADDSDQVTMQRKEQLVPALETNDPRTLGLRVAEARMARGNADEEGA